MPLQNRVTPWGQIIATEERGTMMGNRGIIHRDKQIFRKFQGIGWITCLLDFKNVHRTVMRAGGYTELFFLDEATALSAGHRPCGECQRQRFSQFKSIWLTANSEMYGLDAPTMPQIDRIMQRERINRQEKVVYTDSAQNIGEGAFIEFEGKAYLKWGKKYYEWTPAGYVTAIKLSKKQRVSVLTPRSIVRCFEQGFVPTVHESICKI